MYVISQAAKTSPMSSTLREAKHFLLLLLTTSKLQAHALLDTLDKKQLQAIREILFNILNRNISLSTSQLDIIKRRATLLGKIIKIKGKKSSDLIARHYRTVYNTISMVKEDILKLL